MAKKTLEDLIKSSSEDKPVILGVVKDLADNQEVLLVENPLKKGKK